MRIRMNKDTVFLHLTGTPGYRRGPQGTLRFMNRIVRS